MTQPNRSLFHRIRCVKSSLDNAEQSFLDNKDIRGELDLMLAEAELKNLRRKKDVPWSWNRQLLAGCAAVLLALAGCGGWYFAKDRYGRVAVEAVPAAEEQVVESAKQTLPVVVPAQTMVVSENNVQQKLPEQDAQPSENRVTISRADMHRLVQSARVELSSSN